MSPGGAAASAGEKGYTARGGPMLRPWRLWLGIGGSTLFLGLFLWRADLPAMLRAMGGATYWSLLPAIALYFLALGFRTLRWRVILGPLGRPPLARLWSVMAIGYMANNLLPGRLGEVVRAHFLGEREGISRASALASILVERVLDGLALLFLALLLGSFMPMSAILRSLGEQTGVHWLLLTLGVSVPFLLAMGVLMGVTWLPGPTLRLLVGAAGALPPRLRAPVMEVGVRFLNGLRILRSPRRVGMAFLLSLPVWLAEAAMCAVIGLGFGLVGELQGWIGLAGGMVLAVVAANLGTALPSTGGGIGPFEFFTSVTLQALGVRAGVASAFALVAHITLLLPVTLLGLLYLWMDNLSLLRLLRESRQREAALSVHPSVHGEG
jgi:uncharacterized protein (TIRG00374 family)